MVPGRYSALKPSTPFYAIIVIDLAEDTALITHSSPVRAHRNSVFVMRNIQSNIYWLWPIGLIYHYEYRACLRGRHAMVVDPVTFVLPTVNSPTEGEGFTSFLPDGNWVRLQRPEWNASMSLIVLVPSGQWGLETGLCAYIYCYHRVCIVTIEL